MLLVTSDIAHKKISWAEKGPFGKIFLFFVDCLYNVQCMKCFICNHLKILGTNYQPELVDYIDRLTVKLEARFKNDR